MSDFEPSGNFVSRVMKDVRACEADADRRGERLRALVLSRPGFCILSAVGTVLGLINIVRIALILISPASCL